MLGLVSEALGNKSLNFDTLAYSRQLVAGPVRVRSLSFLFNFDFDLHEGWGLFLMLSLTRP
jgi:hypothetical protein